VLQEIRLSLVLVTLLLFSWPVIIQSTFSVWVMWLYPYVIWLIIILLAKRNTSQQRQDDSEGED